MDKQTPKIEGERVVFFFVLSEKVSPLYLKVAAAFREKGINLVPVNYDQIIQFSQYFPKVKVVILEALLDDHYGLGSINQRLILQLLKTNKLSLFHLSSFRKLSEIDSTLTRRNYHFYKLPLSYDKICCDILNMFEAESKRKNKWPGGNSSALPKVTAMKI
ncbi:MAG: hypothetical protein HOE90_20190 [Bacteriovoracaceae bacterium]|jgi:hypothetical protein|nr:hypothetical protein [Bacteriovoracaceae bacterium]